MRKGGGGGGGGREEETDLGLCFSFCFFNRRCSLFHGRASLLWANINRKNKKCEKASTLAVAALKARGKRQSFHYSLGGAFSLGVFGDLALAGEAEERTRWAVVGMVRRKGTSSEEKADSISIPEGGRK
jgi:hypothetical protein